MMIKRQRTRGRRAQGLLEFALVMPLLLLLLMGVIEFGWLIFNYTQIYNGMREGLRYGSVPSFSGTQAYQDCDGIRDDIIGTAPNLGLTRAEITVSYDQNDYTSIGTCPTGGIGSTTVTAGDRIVIEIKHNVKFLTPFLQTLLPGGFQLDFQAGRSIYLS
jgi:hypothetical protein